MRFVHIPAHTVHNDAGCSEDRAELPRVDEPLGLNHRRREPQYGRRRDGRSVLLDGVEYPVEICATGDHRLVDERRSPRLDEWQGVFCVVAAYCIDHDAVNAGVRDLLHIVSDLAAEVPAVLLRLVVIVVPDVRNLDILRPQHLPEPVGMRQSQSDHCDFHQSAPQNTDGACPPERTPAIQGTVRGRPGGSLCPEERCRRTT